MVRCAVWRQQQQQRQQQKQQQASKHALSMQQLTSWENAAACVSCTSALGHDSSIIAISSTSSSLFRNNATCFCLSAGTRWTWWRAQWPQVNVDAPLID